MITSIKTVRSSTLIWGRRYFPRGRCFRNSTVVKHACHENIKNSGTDFLEPSARSSGIAQRLNGFFVRRDSAEKGSAGVKVGGKVYPPTLISHSGNPITPHQTSGEKRATVAG